jgi:hypothetical protein
MIGKIRETGPGSISISNRQIILPVSGTATAGVIQAAGSNINVNPQSLGGWFSTMSTNYDQYRLKSLRIVWAPALPTTASGSMAFYFDSQVGSPSVPVYESVAGNWRSLVTPVWATAQLDVPTVMYTRLPWYLTKSATAVDTGGADVSCGTIALRRGCGIAERVPRPMHLVNPVEKQRNCERRLRSRRLITGERST